VQNNCIDEVLSQVCAPTRVAGPPRDVNGLSGGICRNAKRLHDSSRAGSLLCQHSVWECDSERSGLTADLFDPRFLGFRDRRARFSVSSRRAATRFDWSGTVSSQPDAKSHQCAVQFVPLQKTGQTTVPPPEPTLIVALYIGVVAKSLTATIVNFVLELHAGKVAAV
jgi:hypothetical protein